MLYVNGFFGVNKRMSTTLVVFTGVYIKNKNVLEKI